MKHLIVYYEPGASCHGPVNSGIWQWGDEIVVGFTKGVFMPDRGKPPLSDPNQPQRNVQARSLDGGLSWAFEAPANLGGGFTTKGLVETEDPPLPLPPSGLDFAHPDFGLRMNGSLLRHQRSRPHLVGALPTAQLRLRIANFSHRLSSPWIKRLSHLPFRPRCLLYGAGQA